MSLSKDSDEYVLLRLHTEVHFSNAVGIVTTIFSKSYSSETLGSASQTYFLVSREMNSVLSPSLRSAWSLQLVVYRYYLDVSLRILLKSHD